MSLFVLALAVHVVAAVLGVGPVAGMALVSSRGPATGESPVARRELLLAVSRWVSGALVLMLLSGVLIDVGSGAGFHETLWYRASVLLLVAIGALNAVARRKLKTGEPGPALRFTARTSWSMCAIVAVIALLMTIRPV